MEAVKNGLSSPQGRGWILFVLLCAICLATCLENEGGGRLNRSLPGSVDFDVPPRICWLRRFRGLGWPFWSSGGGHVVRPDRPFHLVGPMYVLGVEFSDYIFHFRSHATRECGANRRTPPLSRPPRLLVDVALISISTFAFCIV